MTNPLFHLQTFGQTIWLDFIRRGMLTSGEMQRLIDECGVRGVTSNPSIIEKAILGSHDYDDRIRALALEAKGSNVIYEDLTVDDVQRTVDLFRRVYEQTEGKDGFVSLEVKPQLAYDITKTVEEAPPIISRSGCSMCARTHCCENRSRWTIKKTADRALGIRSRPECYLGPPEPSHQTLRPQYDLYIQAETWRTRGARERLSGRHVFRDLPG